MKIKEFEAAQGS